MTDFACENMTDPPEDSPLNWSAIIVLTIGVLAALVVAMVNLSGCWHVVP